MMYCASFNFNTNPAVILTRSGQKIQSGKTELMSRMRVHVALKRAKTLVEVCDVGGRDESLGEIRPSIIGFWGWCRVVCCVNRYLDASQLHYHWPYLDSCDVCCDIFVFIGILFAVSLEKLKQNLFAAYGERHPVIRVRPSIGGRRFRGDSVWCPAGER
jgi:hypothetical protein